MALEALQNTFLGLLALTAVVASLAGFVVLFSFFYNKLKELFTDINYFIFFFLVWGYLLYTLGEVSFYLTRAVAKDTSAIGIQDVYWTGGALLILVSFIALSITLFRQNGSGRKLATLLTLGTIIILGVLALVLTIRDPAQRYFFGTLYPILSSLIVTASLSVVLFYRSLGTLRNALLIFFFASSSILAADVLFHYVTVQEIYGVIGVVTDLFYIAGYGLSAIAFIILRIGLRELSVKVPR